MPQLRIGHSFDIALLVRGRRKQLRLRQAEVARAAGVGREWLVDLEHGKPTAEVGKILRLLGALGIEIEAFPKGRPPDWTIPFTAAAEERRARLAATRPPRERKPRQDITPPDDWPQKHLWPGGT